LVSKFAFSSLLEVMMVMVMVMVMVMMMMTTTTMMVYVAFLSNITQQ
jgi:hypothetical protein